MISGLALPSLHTDLPIGAYIDQIVAQRRDAEFIVYPDRNLRWTYGAFDARVDLLARGLLCLSIQKGDHVGMWARNVPHWLTFLFATGKLGAVLVTINTA